MTRKNARFLILGNLLALSFASSLFAMNAEMPGQSAAAREIIPLNLPQNNFSIDPAGNLSVEGMGLISNSENTQLIQESAQLAPSPFQGEGRGEGKINKKTTPPHPCLHSQSESVPDRLQERPCDPANLLPKGEKELHSFKKNKPAQLLGKQNFSRANLSNLSAVFDGSKINLSANSLEPDENASGILSKFQPDIVLPIKTLGTGEETSGNNGFQYPRGVFVDSKGHIYVADSHNNRIQIFDSSGKYLRTLGTGQATSGNDGFNSPQSVSVDSKGDIYVADTGNRRIQIFDSSGKYLRTLGTGKEISGNDGFNSPTNIFVDSKGIIYVADSGNRRIQIFDSSGKYLRTLGAGKETSGNDGFSYPRSVFVDSKGDIYVADTGNHRIQIFDSSGKYLRTLGTGKEISGNDGFKWPQSVFVDSKGNIYVADFGNRRIQIFDSSEKYLRTLGTGKEISGNDGFSYPRSVFVDSKGDIYVADTGNHRIQIFSSIDEMEAADKKRQDDAEEFLSQETKAITPEPSNKKEETSVRDRFKIIWDDASRFLP